jgi:acyl dehydratase
MFEPPANLSLAAYSELIGSELGVSEWLTLDQSRVTEFGRCTQDEQFIHVDPELASRASFGGTIAHGFLLLSLLSAMVASATPQLLGTQTGLNYGFNKVRFLTPVRTGRRIRGRFVLKTLQQRSPSSVLSTYEVTVEIENEPKAALVAEWLTLSLLSVSIG